MKILLTNDDGIQAKGINVLVRILKKYGDITVVAPKKGQSGMSMAIPLGLDKKIYVSDLEIRDGVRYQWVDSTPDACVKFALDETFRNDRPDVIISGINHGTNAATASCYSGTLGAAAEGAVNGIRAIGVSLDSWDPDADFSIVEEIFPEIFEKLMKRGKQMDPLCGVYYNINFPDLPKEKIKGISICNMGFVHWTDEFVKNEDGSYHIEGFFSDYKSNPPTADHRKLKEGYITIVPHKIDNTDYAEMEELRQIF